MGVTFGQMEEGLEIPYQRIGSRAYEVRRYDSYFVAEVKATDAELQTAFNLLERYIGRRGEPENIKGAPIASITSHLAAMHEKIPFRLPVIRENHTLQFVLPIYFTSFEQVPVPTNPLVSIRCVPVRNVAVLTFFGQCKRVQYTEMLNELRSLLELDKMVADYPQLAYTTTTATATAVPKSDHFSMLRSVPSKDPITPEEHWSVAQYHPNTTLRCCRRNEVWIDLNEKNENVAELLNC